MPGQPVAQEKTDDAKPALPVRDAPSFTRDDIVLAVERFNSGIQSEKDPERFLEKGLKKAAIEKLTGIAKFLLSDEVFKDPSAFVESCWESLYEKAISSCGAGIEAWKDLTSRRPWRFGLINGAICTIAVNLALPGAGFAIRSWWYLAAVLVSNALVTLGPEAVRFLEQRKAFRALQHESPEKAAAFEICRKALKKHAKEMKKLSPEDRIQYEKLVVEKEVEKLLGRREAVLQSPLQSTTRAASRKTKAEKTARPPDQWK